MKFTIQNKIILSNILIVLLSLITIATIVVQGMLYYNIQHTEDLLIQSSNNGNLFIQQYILTQQQNSNLNSSDIYQESKTYLAEELAKQTNTRVQLFDQSAELLADSAFLDTLPPSETRQEVGIAIEQSEKAYVVKKLQEGRFIYFASPIVMENQQIGVLSLLYSLGNVDRLIQQSITLFIWAGIAGLFIIYFISLYLTRRILKPIYRLIDSSEKIASGNYKHQIDYFSKDEIGELTRSFNLMVINIREKVHEINSEKHKLESVLSSIEDGVVAVDNDKNLLALNDSAKEIFSMVESHNYHTIFTYDFMEELYRDVQKEHKGITREILFKNRYLLIYTSEIHVQSASIGFIFVLRDITKIRELEAKQRQFISSVSHELRTPLTTVIGYSDMLQRRGVTDPELLDKSIGLIKREGERLLRLVDDLLNLSNLEKMEFNLVKTQIDLIQLLDDVVTQMRVKGKKYNNEIQFTYTSFPKINGDFDRLKQVFINIIDNAIKYSFPGGMIQILTEQVDEFIVVSIRDFGAGIEEDNLSRVFEPFYRVDKVRSRNLGGSGLGLSIVKEIIEKHEGSIHIESQIDEGTLIIVKLPIS